MASEAHPIPAQEVLDFLSKRSKSVQLDVTQLQDREFYRRAAAVLAGVGDTSSLKPFGPTSPSASAAKLLREDLVPTSEP